MKAQKKVAVAAFFAALVAVGLVLHGDYGVGWDEQNNFNYGAITLDHVLGRNADAHHYRNPDDFWHPVSGQFARTHGPAFEVLLVAIERASGLGETPGGIKLRHLCVYLTLVGGAFFFYLLCRRVFSSVALGLLGALLYMLHPRIFAHGFHNSMDIGFLALFTVCMFTMLRCVERPGLARGCIHGLACAVLVDIRIAGLLVPCLSGGFLLLELAAASPRLPQLRRSGACVGGFVLLFFPVVVLLWPMLWSDPVGNLLAALSVSSKDPWNWWELYLGQKIYARDVPWHFTPVWLLVTTPPLQLALAVVGLGALAAALRPRWSCYREHRGLLLGLCCLLGPLAAVALLRSTLFNGWRHMYFIYPGLLLPGLYGVAALRRWCGRLQTAWARRAVSALLATLLLYGVGSTVAFMVRSHPQQVAYFNVFTGGLAGARARFQTGYWGSEYREGLEQILKLHRRPGCCIRIYASREPAAMAPVGFNLGLLPEPQRSWFQITEDLSRADYFLTNFCNHIPHPRLPELWSREVDGVKVIALYRGGAVR